MRARNIKPGFYKNADLAECSVWARLLFPGLWMIADREGRLIDRPKQIKGELLPYDSVDVEPLLRELAAHGFIVRYEIDGQRYIEIPSFGTHQSPHYSEKASAIKPPELPESAPQIEPTDSEKSASSSEPDSGSAHGEVPEHSGNSPPIKEGPQRPDSLNPDSLNPDSLNPESGKKTTRAKARASPSLEIVDLQADGLPHEVASDFLALRKRKRAPLTRIAWQDIKAEAEKAGWSPEKAVRKAIARGWQGFEAEWVVQANGSHKEPHEIAAEALRMLEERDRREQERTAKAH